MAYVNGFLAPLAKDQLDGYRKTSAAFGKVVMAKGALSFMESVGEGMEWGTRTSFPRAVDLKDGEVVVFSWIVFPSKAVADTALEAVMADPEVQAAMAASPMDGKRVVWGGFESLLSEGVGA